MKIGIYPGSYDPVTKGHMDIIERAAGMVDELIVAVLVNPHKNSGLFGVEERIDMLKETTKHLRNVKIEYFSGLLVDYAKDKNASVIIRGLRAVTDFEYEMQMAQINKSLLPEVETIFLATNAEYSFLSSSSVRELAMFNGKIHGLVSDYVVQKITEKFKETN